MICIVIPCYNEENRFPVEEFNNFYNNADNVHFLLVNDGSKDNTLSLLNGLAVERENRIMVYNLSQNSGKAEAVRQGMLEAVKNNEFEAIGYFDADFATPLEEVFLLYDHLKKNNSFKIAFGSRVRRLGATIERSAKRHYLGRIFSTIASIILKLPVYDTQCGAKLFKRDVVQDLFGVKFLSKWLFDIEVFARFVKKYGKASTNYLVEVPLNIWLEKGGSKLKFSYLIKVPLELLKIKNHYKKNNL